MTAIGPGMRVKCIKDASYYPEPGFEGGSPTIGSCWTVDWFQADPEGDYIGLAEWPEQNICFLADCFVPLDGNEDISALENVLKIQSRAPEFTP